MSHRFAGPIFSLRRAIRSVVEGETPRKMKFRKHDFWQGLADDYNAMLVKLGALKENESETADDEKLVESK
jgi:nitrogen fixation/metabolism regulation signal transduction histidine kinase